MINLDDWLPSVRTLCHNIPDLTAKRCIRTAAQQFCRRTLIWKVNHTMQMVAGDNTLQISADSQVFKVVMARMNDIELVPMTEYQMDMQQPGWSFEATEPDVNPQYIIAPAPNIIRLYPVATGEIKLRLALIPSDKAISLPDQLLQHRETIATGAAAIAMLMPQVDFSNPAAAAVFEGKFKTMTDTEMMRTYRSDVSVRPRIKPRFF
jgi:hypothetical protein